MLPIIHSIQDFPERRNRNFRVAAPTADKTAKAHGNFSGLDGIRDQREQKILQGVFLSRP
jgi:hypothetical protein